MTAYLQRGDKIHIAFPVSSMLYGRELESRVLEDAKRLTDAFAMHGVTVTSYSANSALPGPVVVAVFRPALPEQAA